ncbi:hypothetical protein REPUB_Repub06bG0150300 [Reevesia pubescens]
MRADEGDEVNGDGVKVDEDGFNGDGVNEDGDEVENPNTNDETGHHSEHYDSDEYGDPVSDEGKKVDDATLRKTRYPVYKPIIGALYIEIGMLFKDSKEFKHVVSLMAIYSNRPIVWARNNRNLVRVKTYNQTHDCNKVFTNPRMSEAVLSELCLEKLMKNPYMKDANVQEAISQKYGTWVKVSMIRKAQKVIDKVVTNYKDQFDHLWDYTNALRESNSGSTVKMQVHRPFPYCAAVFQRYYVCLRALKTGFLNGYRHFLGMDGCFLKSLRKGELLYAVGRARNNQMFPVASALVEVECTNSWR